MFEVVALSSGFANKRLWSTCAGITAEALLLVCAALAPLVSPQALPHSRAIMAWLLPMTPPPPPAAGDAAKPRPARPSPERLQTVPGRLTEPASIPPKAAIIVDEPLETSGYGVPGGVYTGERDGVPGGFLSVLQDAAPPAPAVQTPPAPVATPIPIAPQQVPVGGQVKMARLIYRVEPLYPPLARQMHVSGVVELVGIIATNGRIRELKLLSGNPLLVPSVLEAVRQWIYEPTLLDGKPVELIATISVVFRLN